MSRGVPQDQQANYLCFYYAREGFWHHVLKTAAEENARQPKWQWQFWQAVAQGLQNTPGEGLSQLTEIAPARKSNQTVPCAVALAWFHQQCELVDHDAVRQQEFAVESSRVDHDHAVLAVMFLIAVKDLEMAKRILNMAEESPTMVALRGWAELYEQREEYSTVTSQQASESFDQALKQTPQLLELEALMGQLKVNEERRDWAKAIEAIDRTVVNHPWYLPVLVEKAKIVMMTPTADMDQSMEIASTVLDREPHNIDALRVNALYVLTREARQQNSLAIVQRLSDAINKTEPRNHRVMYQASRLIARIAAKKDEILRVTLQMVTRACELAPNMAKYYTERGYQMQLSGNLVEACEMYHQASNKDETDVAALYGIIHARILEGNLEEADEQLEFLTEIQGESGKTSELAYLACLIKWRRHRDADGAINHLNEALTRHITSFKQAAGFDFFVDLNAELMLNIARQYLEHAQQAPSGGHQAEQQRKQMLLRGVKVLETVTRFVPSLLPAQVLLAKSKLQLADIDGAQLILKQCLQMDPPSDVYLLLARISYERENMEEANQFLEKGMANDFAVRKHPLFHLVRAQVHLSNGETEAAVKALEEAMKIPGIRTIGAKKGQSVVQESMIPFTTQDRAQIFKLLITAYSQLKKYDEATKCMQDASAEFANTAEEVTILVCNAELAIQKGEVEQALSMLKAMPATSPYYAAAKRAMADIYLKHRKDKRAFARCYKDIVEAQPSSENYLILGDALLAIHEPSDAIKVFEEANNLNGDNPDPAIMAKIGKTHAQTHDYTQAIQYYQETIKQLDPSHPFSIQMKKDLAELEVKLGSVRDAVYLIEDAMQWTQPRTPEQETATLLRTRIDLHIFLAEVLRESTDEGDDALVRSSQNLQEARELQKVLKEKFVESETELKQLREQVADLSFELGKHYEERQVNVEEAMRYFEEALQSVESHEKSALALGNIYLRKKDYDMAEKNVMRILRFDPSNEEASMLMAELMMELAASGGRSEGGMQEYRDAAHYYQNLLDKSPCNWHALSRMVFLLRRAGRLNDFKRSMTAAQKACARSAEKEAGFRFCRGLYHRYMNKPQDALIDLNFARQRDPDYRADALVQMIEVYMNADAQSDVESLEQGTDSGHADHLREVDHLVKDLSLCSKLSRSFGPVGTSETNWLLRIKVYECQSLMFSRVKANVENAVYLLTQIFERPQHRNYVPALLALSQALVIQKQVTKARNQLKRIADIAKKSYSPEWSDDFERAWLLLADIYIQGAKYDLASQLCHLAKDHNRSCGKAWELIGLIYEREQSYKDAAHHYEKAWELGNQSNAAVGFRLSFNYLKAKRYVEAINVCNAVLEKNPDYPKIRKEVLEKAWQSLRV
jgi:tetratricopeptide repeat protein 21B